MADDAPSIEPATERFLAHIGWQAAVRPRPRLASAIGAFAAVMGGLAVSSLGGEVVDGGAPRATGALIALLYAGGGLALVVSGRRSQRTAGVVAVAVAVPAVYGFLVFTGDFDRNDPTTVLALAAVTWGALHVVGPTRGHPVLLAGALAGAWATVVFQVGVDALSATLDVPFANPAGPAFFEPDTAGAAITSLCFGVGYLAAGYGLDRAGLRGTATVFVGVAVAALAVGVFAASVGRDPWLVGLLLVSAGGLLGFVGDQLGRRLSTWVGAGVAVGGVMSLVDAAVPDDQVTTGALLGLGAAALVVMAVPALAEATGDDGLGDGSDGDGGEAMAAPDDA